MTDAEYEQSTQQFDLTVIDRRMIYTLIENAKEQLCQHGKMIDPDDPSGFEGICVAEFLVWCDKIQSAVGTP